MNRVKLWSYAALLIAAGVVNLAFVSRWITQRSLAQIDRELRLAAAQVDVRSQLLAAEAAQLAEAVARAPAVVQALLDEGEDAARTAQVAGETAARLAADPARPLLVASSSGAGRTVRVQAAAVELEPQSEGLVWGAAGDGLRREGYVIAADALFYVVAVPAGRGAGIAVGVPITAATLAAVRASSGCDVTVLVDGQPRRSTLRGPDAQLVAAAAPGAMAGRAVDVGRLGRQAPAFRVGVSLPPLPPVFVAAPALRVQAVGLKGLTRGAFALSVSTAPLLAPVVSYEWLVLGAILGLLLLGVLVGLLLTNEEAAAGKAPTASDRAKASPEG